MNKLFPRRWFYIWYFVAFTVASLLSALFGHLGTDEPIKWGREFVKSLLTGFAVAGNFTLFHEWLLAKLMRSEQLKAQRKGAV